MPYARRDILTWQEGMYYHIYNRGVNKSTLFREPKNYVFVIPKIKEYSLANHLAMIAYCLEPNHYHFLLRQDEKEPAGNLPQLVFNSYAKAYNKMYQHGGTLFEGRFHAKPVQNKSHLLHLCRYIHGNPVKDGIVADITQWPYSNYLEWIGERDGKLVDKAFVQDNFDTPDEYRKFVLEYLRSRQLPDDIQQYLNSLDS